MLGLICTVIQETIAQLFNSRGKMLAQMLASVRLEQVLVYARADMATVPVAKWRRHLLGSKNALKGIIEYEDESHDIGYDKYPHDIGHATFSDSIIKIIGLFDTANANIDFGKLVQAAVLPESLKNRLLALDTSAGDFLQQLRVTIEAWYTQFMDQVQHWYTRRAQIASLVIALLVAGALKVDTIELAKGLYGSDAARSAAVAMAEHVSQQGSPAACQQSNIADCTDQVRAALPLPMGWQDWPALDWSLLSAIPGILLSGLAMSLGSRFWFDTLRSIVALRTGGNPGKGNEAKTDE
ncbi:hypothetical protein EOE18_01460 [Novosphingobium umbonatum]|uniref:Uncharacterized protein n=1 Tax=Novosphingobium umbonatum TaxID=1908524 RepID=A0A3S2YBC6_9SPHN|nr:hypothetical protein [Novosphingobium umbonatum]RVU07775.1 hypothetical protein EOE18_01460 [Novosphingobium umbonatum]